MSSIPTLPSLPTIHDAAAAATNAPATTTTTTAPFQPVVPLLQPFTGAAGPTMMMPMTMPMSMVLPPPSKPRASRKRPAPAPKDEQKDGAGSGSGSGDALTAMAETVVGTTQSTSTDATAPATVPPTKARGGGSKARASKIPKTAATTTPTISTTAPATTSTSATPGSVNAQLQGMQELLAAQFQSQFQAASAAAAGGASSTTPGGVPSNLASMASLASMTMRPAPFLTPQGLFMSEPDPFGTETPSALRFPTWQSLDEFIKVLSMRNGFRHVLRRSHKDDNGEYRHGTYVCEFHASPNDGPGNQMARASSRSIRLSCPYKINFARQGEHGVYHVNKRVLGHSHVIDSNGMMGFGQMAHLPINMSLPPPTMLPPHPTTTATTTPATSSVLPSLTATLPVNAAAANSLLTPPPTLINQSKVEAGSAKVPNLKRLLDQSHLLGPDQSVTEATNSISLGCDHFTPIELVRTLRECDAQIWNGFQGLPGLLDSENIAAATQLIEVIGTYWSQPNTKIVLGGAGTSGRIAWFIATRWNAYLNQSGSHPTFHYLIAGGDRSLLLSEANIPEDDADQGLEDLKALIGDDESENASNVVYIGITCGLTAPYIAGQLYFSSALGRAGNRQIHTALIGFNTPARARDQVMDRWSGLDAGSFRLVVQQMEQQIQSEQKQEPSARSCTILTPIVGPEYITGSTRMKGGSTTLMLLDCIISGAIKAAAPDANSKSIRTNYLESIQTYERVFRETYLHADKIAEFVEKASLSLRHPSSTTATASSSHIYYVSFSSIFGSMAFIDASEMNDTFGAGYERVRAFFKGGLNSLVNHPASFKSQIGNHHDELFAVTFANFKQRILSILSPNDTVILLFSDDKESEEHDINLELAELTNSKAKLGAIHITNSNAAASGQQEKLRHLFGDLLCSIDLSHTTNPCAQAFAIKLILNAISTGAHVRNGYVLSNRMINLTITNTKLYTRAIGLITELTSVSSEMAERQLLRAIYQTDAVSPDILHAKVGTHVERAANTPGVVSLALMLAECESSRLPSPAPLDQFGTLTGLSTLAPAITVAQASRRLQSATFTQLMQAKYDSKKKPAVAVHSHNETNSAAQAVSNATAAAASAAADAMDEAE